MVILRGRFLQVETAHNTVLYNWNLRAQEVKGIERLHAGNEVKLRREASSTYLP